MKKHLEKMGKPELLNLVLDLSKMSKSNKTFIEHSLKGRANPKKVKAIVERCKKELYGIFYKRSDFPQGSISFREGKRILKEYSVILGSNPEYVADVRLHYVEVGTKLTGEFGDMDEGFYGSLELAFDDFVEHLVKSKLPIANYGDRIRKILETAGEMGWGYQDSLMDSLETRKLKV